MAYPSASPDGKAIACVGRDGAKQNLIILPLDGGQPLKKISLPEGTFSGTRLQWSADSKMLIYAIDRDDIATIIKQPLEGVAEKVISFGEDELFDFGYSVDGRFLAVTRGEWQHDAVLISDLNLY